MCVSYSEVYLSVYHLSIQLRTYEQYMVLFIDVFGLSVYSHTVAGQDFVNVCMTVSVCDKEGEAAALPSLEKKWSGKRGACENKTLLFFRRFRTSWWQRTEQ